MMAINFDNPPLYDNFTDKGDRMSNLFRDWLATFFQTVIQKLLFSQVVTTNQQMQITNAYYANGTQTVLLALPQSADIGDIIEVAALNANGWQITQTEGQQIRFKTSLTTVGAVGSLASTAIGDVATLKCIVTNTTWMVFANEGTLTVV